MALANEWLFFGVGSLVSDDPELQRRQAGARIWHLLGILVLMIGGFVLTAVVAGAPKPRAFWVTFGLAAIAIGLSMFVAGGLAFRRAVRLECERRPDGVVANSPLAHFWR